MGRHRRQTGATRRRDEDAARAAELQREGRRWFIRALLAAVAGGAISLLTVVVAVVLAIVAAVCAAKGAQRAVEAMRLLETP